MSAKRSFLKVLRYCLYISKLRFIYKEKLSLPFYLFMYFSIDISVDSWVLMLSMVRVHPYHCMFHCFICLRFGH